MSFIESFGGKWKVKQIPNEEQMAVRLKQNELFQFPPEFFENAKKIVVETGTFPTNNIYEVGDGVYCAKTEFAELTQEVHFRLDGTPTTNKRIPDGKDMVTTASFVDGAWTLSFKMEGIPEFVSVKTRSGDEVVSIDTIDGVTYEDTLIKA